MQIINQKNIVERLLFYWARLFSQSIKQGQDYSLLKKSIVILIADFELDGLEFIKKYMTKWQIREEDYSSIVLTDSFEAVILELPKFIKYSTFSKSQNMNLWLKFIENPEVNIMEELKNTSNTEDLKQTADAIELAQARLQQLSEDEHERELALLREKYILDQNSIEKTGYDRGFKEGHTEGLAEGFVEGLAKIQKEIIKKMLKKEYTDTIIIELTNISKEDLLKIKNEM